MAFGRGRGAGSMDEDEPMSSGGETGGLTAFIDQGSSFEGKLSFKDTVRIDGHFSGEITSENTLVVGETGEIDANIRSQTVIVSGLIHGDICAARRVVLHKTARVDGNVETPSLVIEDGAVVNGNLKMSVPDMRKSTVLKAVDNRGAGEARPDAKPAAPKPV